MEQKKKKLSRAERKARKKRSRELDYEYGLKEKLEKKDFLLIPVIVILAVVVFFNLKSPAVKPENNTASSPVVNHASVSSPATNQAQTQTDSNSTQNETPAPTENGETESPDELSQAIETACAAVNKAKHTENFSATKDQEIKLALTECSIPGMTTLANPILERYGKRRVIDFKFENGVGYDETHKEEVSAADAIPPTEKDFALDKNGISSYEISKNGENTKYVFKLIEENSTLDNPVPTYHAMAMDYLDMAGIDIAPAQITQADFNYPGATVTIEVDPSGNLAYFEEYMPVCGTGAGRLGLSASGTIDGYIDEIWTFNW